MKMPERIRRARRKAGLSQAGLADQLLVRRSAVSNWESANDIQPSLQNLIAIAKSCGVSLEWLGTGRGEMCPDDGFLGDIPAADAELVESRDERELLAVYRELPKRSQELFRAVLDTFLRQGRRTTRRSRV